MEQLLGITALLVIVTIGVVIYYSNNTNKLLKKVLRSIVENRISTQTISTTYKLGLRTGTAIELQLVVENVNNLSEAIDKWIVLNELDPKRYDKAKQTYFGWPIIINPDDKVVTQIKEKLDPKIDKAIDKAKAIKENIVKF